MSRYLLDTHVWLWYLAGSRDLPTTLREALDDAAGLCWLSPISVWEANMLVERGRVRSVGGRDWVRDALEKLPLREAPINFEVARTIADLVLPHNDPADHFLAATALTYDLTLVTLDGHLLRAEWLPTLTA